MSESKQKKLLSIVELGGYPDYGKLYQQLGFDVERATSMRKALGLLKKNSFDVVVCEFNFQSDFRDRTSSLESMMAVLQRDSSATRVVVFYEQEYAHQFHKVEVRFPIHAALTFPLDEARLEQVLKACL